MGTVEPYQLKALSEEESWDLFESLAFDKRPHERDDSRLISIGREIVKKCVNVPLAIRTIASHLRSKHTEEEWVRFVDKELRFIEQNGRGTNAIMSTLKLSYDHLPSQLKQCFAYCSLFPKDYKLDKQRLIWLWMAQGFLGQPLGDENLEDVGDEYFMELLRRCFFQNVKRNKFGMIEGCMMHDLFHDLASKVGDDQLLLIEGQVPDDSIRHVSFVPQTNPAKRDAPFSLHIASQMRSLLYVDSIHSWCISKSTILSLRHIRALHLTNLISLGSLRNSIGKLKHLRYLAIQTSSKSLRSGITGLQNLQTLDLLGSRQLRKLPKGFHKLFNLRHLRIGDGNALYRRSFPELIEMPLKVAGNIQGRLLNQLLMTQEEAVEGTSSCVFELKKLYIYGSDGLDSLSIDFSNSLHTLCVSHCRELASLSAESKSSLRYLKVEGCSRLKDITSVLRQLPVLEKLKIFDCDFEKLDLREVGSGCQIGWQGLENLKMLLIERCSKLTSLQYLPCGLTDLMISACHELASLGGLGNLTQLRNLIIWGCPGLRP